MRNNQDTLISVDGLHLSLGGREVLADVSLRLRRGEILTVIGPNGSGKTSLVRVILGLLPAGSGSARLQPGLRVGYMPQKLHVDAILPLTVRRFLLLGGRRSDEDLRGALQEVGAQRIMDRPIQSVSGGELQRALLARALLRNPDLLVLDEPVQGVDLNGQAELYALIKRIRDTHACGILMVSHDLHLVMAATDHVVCLNHHVCCSGSPEVVSRDPAYLGLFGTGARELAVYTHRHNHTHNLHGDVVGSSDDNGPDEEHHGDG